MPTLASLTMRLQAAVRQGGTAMRRIALVLGLLGLAPFLAAQNKPDVATPTSTPVAAGQETFRTYCASCHGLDAKGAGPAVAGLKSKPPDLTQLSKRNGGKFPSARVETVLEHSSLFSAHRSQDMPVWGDAFRNANRDERLVKLKIHNVVLYIESVQEK
jgi:mono/diheme cytochrome c family protein